MIEESKNTVLLRFRYVFTSILINNTKSKESDKLNIVNIFIP